MGIFNFKKDNDKEKLEKEISFLKSELENCGKKLKEKQEHINKTNSFWKKKLYQQSEDRKK
ncbi:MAG: hypothetical protein ACK52I_30910 [Pseudomonadota bacterium]|jgi:peptidoglycan hydrolase CwlO-like protein